MRERPKERLLTEFSLIKIINLLLEVPLAYRMGYADPKMVSRLPLRWRGNRRSKHFVQWCLILLRERGLDHLKLVLLQFRQDLIGHLVTGEQKQSGFAGVDRAHEACRGSASAWEASLPPAC